MQCENCHTELNSNSTSCPNCGELILQNVEGFGNTKEIERRLRTIVETYGKRVVINNLKFVALINDFLPEFDKERGLLKNMIEADVLINMLKEETPDMAIMKAKSYMLHKLFIAENAAEFVIVCFAYMLNVPYDSPLRVKDEEELKKEEEDKQEKRRFMAVNIEERVLTPIDAVKYRLALNVSVPEGYTKIDNFCFDKFSLMRTIKLPSTVLAVGEYAFSECKRLRSISLPENLRIIKQGAFSQCSKLTVINIPHGVLEIEDNTFSFCQELEVVEIPSTVGSIGASAFLGCEKLRKLFLPDSIKFIDEDAFTYCTELTIYCYENSYVHKFCLNNNINVETVAKGEALRQKMG